MKVEDKNGVLCRSVINNSIDDALHLISVFNFPLPQYARWTCEDWNAKGAEFDEIRHCMLGWDVTDFGSQDFHNIGRVLFTARNGRLGDSRFPKEYAEKVLIDPENQRAPAHYHKSKREDIICRAGGNILVQLTRADKEGDPDKQSFPIQIDGCTKRLNPGDIVRLTPGMSLNIPPFHIHQFWGEEGTGIPYNGKRYTLSTEISSVCDDHNDNFFLEDFGERFPTIREDVKMKYYLCNEYPLGPK